MDYFPDLDEFIKSVLKIRRVVSYEQLSTLKIFQVEDEEIGENSFKVTVKCSEHKRWCFGRFRCPHSVAVD